MTDNTLTLAQRYLIKQALDLVHVGCDPVLAMAALMNDLHREGRFRGALKEYLDYDVQRSDQTTP